MKSNFLKVLAIILVLSMCFGALAGCGSNGSTVNTGNTSTESSNASSDDTAVSQKTESTETSNQAEDQQETVNITWHRTAWHTNADEKEVEKAINEYIEPLIGVTVTVLNDAENTALDLSLAAGDDIDVFWAASWSKAYDYIDGDIAYDITDLLPQYPELYNSMPEYVWESSKNGGHNYYVPVYKEIAAGQGLSVPSELVEKYNWDISAVKELKDIEPMLADCLADGMSHPYVAHASYYDAYGLDDYSFLTKYAGVDRDGDTTKIVNIVESEEYAEFINLMHSWNEAGYINQEEVDAEAISEARVKELRAAGGNAFFRWATTPDSKANASARNGMDVEVIPLTESYIETDSVAGSLCMINANTKKYDACMKFLQLLNTDETLANLAAFGIEDKHYSKTDEGRISLIADSGYLYPGVWIVCNVNAPSLLENESADKKEQYAEFNDSAAVSCTAGFRLDKTKVQAEMTAIDNVYEEYQLLLEKGFYDPEEYLPKFREALKTAGVDKVIAEMQTQYEAWLSIK